MTCPRNFTVLEQKVDLSMFSLMLRLRQLVKNCRVAVRRSFKVVAANRKSST